MNPESPHRATMLCVAMLSLILIATSPLICLYTYANGPEWLRASSGIGGLALTVSMIFTDVILFAFCACVLVAGDD